MAALPLYGYSRGVYSSRKLAQACVERLDFMAVTAINRPDFRTIAKFRARHLEALGGVLLQALKQCGGGTGQAGPCGPRWDEDRRQRQRAEKAMSYGR